MSERRIGRTVNIADVAGPMADRWQHIRDQREQERIERVNEGVAKFGWSPDAECPNCGDTGKWPKSIHYCGCRAGSELRLSDEGEAEKRARLGKWERAGVPARFAAYRLATAPNVEAAAKVLAWVDIGAWSGGQNLLLHGTVGTGKTGLAVGALRAIHEQDGPAMRFWSVPMLLDRMRPGSDEDPMDEACRVPIVVLDDLGVEKPSDWVRERLYVLVNARYEDRRPTIVTTNVPVAGLAAALGERLVSRLAEDVEVVLVDGPDRRAR